MTQTNSKASDRFEIRKSYFETGDLWVETPYLNGKEHGTEKIYYKSGALLCETPYVKGKIHGITRSYYESGALERESPYVNGKRHGIVKNYNREKSNIDRLTLYNKDLIFLSLRRESYNATCNV